MNRKHQMGAFLFAAASLLVTGAYAQDPHAAPQAKANAADKAEKAATKPGDKAGDKAEKAADKAGDKADKAADKAGEKAGEKGKSADDRAARKAKEHDAQREKLKGMLKGPPDDALKQELRRHAERLARLDRIKDVAQAEKDTATVEKATSLVAKENERHDKWMTKHVATPTPAADSKGGAQ